MAASGYKLFATGDVLTAADVNNYLMLQTVMVFANSAARTTALSGVLAEGLVSYLKDTDVVEVYTGAAWVSLDDPNAVQNSGYYAAGKNAIINGAFNVNQRAFTSNTATNSFNFDRFLQNNGGTSGTLTITPQVFTPGTAPVAGYESTNYIQCVTAAGASINTFALLRQNIEDVRTFAGQTITVSFWAKAASGTPKIAVETEQGFGSGGSPSVAVYTAGGSVTTSTSWARYSVNVAVPSISGKTIGTTANTSYISINLWFSAGTDFASRTNSIGLQNATFQMWGIQAEIGATATAFQTASGTIGGELALCQRYYQVIGGTTNSYPIIGGSGSSGAGQERRSNPFPVQMRTSPTITKNGTWNVANCGQPSSNYINEQGFSIETAVTGAGSWYLHPNSTDDTFTISAEL